VDPHHVDADPDADPDSTYHPDADPGYQNDADPGGSGTTTLLFPRKFLSTFLFQGLRPAEENGSDGILRFWFVEIFFCFIFKSQWIIFFVKHRVYSLPFEAHA
jgi:hypothetical protein